MGNHLYEKWLEEEVTDLQKALLYGGLINLFRDFEEWLVDNGYVNSARD